MALVEAAESGDRLETLRELRDVLARAVDQCESMRDVAALAGRLQAVLAEIAVLDPQVPEVDLVDEIAQRRDTRRSGSASGSARAGRSG